jgi:hypothetical protein
MILQTQSNPLMKTPSTILTAPFALGGAYDEAVIEDGAIGYWRFEEAPGATTAQDSTGGGTNGTYNGITLGQPGAIGNGAVWSEPDEPGSSNIDFGDFGAGALAQLTNIDNPEDENFDPEKKTSLEFWMKTLQVSGNANNWRSPLVFGRESPGDGDIQWGWVTDAGEIGFAVNDAGGGVFRGPVVNNDQWHHVVQTFDFGTGDTVIYVDGEEALNATAGGNRDQDEDALIQFMGWNHHVDGGAGAASPHLLGQFVGSLDEVAIYPSILTAEQVKAHFIAGSYTGAVLEDEPISYWQFDDAGDTAADSGASETDGKYVGVAKVDGYQGTAASFEDNPGSSHIDFDEFGVGSLAQLVNDDQAGEEDPEQKTTLEFWMKTAQEGQDASNWRTATVFGEESGGDGDIQWAYILPTGQLGAIAVNDQHLHVTENPINDNKWHHYVITYDWAAFKSQLYIDGELDSDLEGGDNVFTDTDGNIRYMGWNSIGQGGQGQFVGLLDEVAIYDKILSAERVKVHASFASTAPADRDGDGDGLSDILEEGTEGLDPDNPADATEDADGDGLDNITELLTTETDFKKADTDGDGLNDKVEIDGGLDPLNGDTDGDGLADGVETNTGTFVSATDTGTDPKKIDTDGDEFGDANEVQLGSDPNDANSKPTLAWANVIAAADPAYWYRFNGDSKADGVENEGRIEGFDGTFSNKVVDDDLGKDSAFPSLGIAFEFTGPEPDDLFHTEDPDAYSDGASFVDFGDVIPELTNLRSEPMEKSTTVEYWLKTSHIATTGNQTWNSPAVLAHESPGDGDIYWGWIRDDGDFGFSTSDIREIHSVRDADYEVVNDEWHHVMMVKEWRDQGPATSALYIDGGEVSGGATIEDSTGAGNPSLQDDDGQIQYLGFVEKGRDGNANVQYIGLLDELVIYDRALTEQDAALHYSAGVTGPPDRGVSALGFRIIDFEINAAGTEVILTWSSRAGRTYAVETTTNFVNFTELADGVESEGDTTSYTDTTIPADAKFLYYRVKEEE